VLLMMLMLSPVSHTL